MDDWTDERHPAHPADAEIERRLAVYARARLTRERVTVDRSRAAVLAHARVALVRATASPRVPTRRLALGIGRRPTLAFVAAILLVGALAGGTVAGSGAGGPLYGARLWVEAFLLPAAPSDRAAANLSRLQSRLDEAESAAVAGDAAAVAAALGAYREVLDDAVAASDGSVDLETRLELVLGRHRIVLETVATKLPPAAQKGIGRALENAIRHSERAADRMKDHGAPPVSPGPASSPGSTPASTSEPGAPDASPPGGPPSNRPEKSPKPDKSDKP